MYHFHFNRWETTEFQKNVVISQGHRVCMSQNLSPAFSEPKSSVLLPFVFLFLKHYICKCKGKATTQKKPAHLCNFSVEAAELSTGKLQFSQTHHSGTPTVTMSITPILLYNSTLLPECNFLMCYPLTWLNSLGFWSATTENWLERLLNINKTILYF